jgi:hypothetical protein
LINGVWRAAFEGTDSTLQWIEDFDAIMEEVPGFGGVSQGFNIGLPNAWRQMYEIIGQLPWVASGHSRGAAQCTLMTGHAILAGHPPRFRCVFGEPLSGDARAAKIIGTVPSFSFCRKWQGAEDPIVRKVADVLSLAGYVRVSPLIELDGAPSADNPWLDYPEHGALHYCPDYERTLGRYLNRPKPSSCRIIATVRKTL